MRTIARTLGLAFLSAGGFACANDAFSAADGAPGDDASMGSDAPMSAPDTGSPDDGSSPGVDSGHPGDAGLDAPFDATPALLVGASVVLANNRALAQQASFAYQFTAVATGTPKTAHVYLGPGTAAVTVVVALYSDDGAGGPGAVVTEGTLATVTPSAWNLAPLAPSGPVIVNTKYWLAIVSTNGGPLVLQVYGPDGGPATSDVIGMALPDPWPGAAPFAEGPVSAYITN